MFILQCSKKDFEGQEEISGDEFKCPNHIGFLFELLHMTGAHKRKGCCASPTILYIQSQNEDIAELMYITCSRVNSSKKAVQANQKLCKNISQEQRRVWGLGIKVN